MTWVFASSDSPGDFEGICDFDFVDCSVGTFVDGIVDTHYQLSCWSNFLMNFCLKFRPILSSANQRHNRNFVESSLLQKQVGTNRLIHHTLYQQKKQHRIVSLHHCLNSLLAIVLCWAHTTRTVRDKLTCYKRMDHPSRHYNHLFLRLRLTVL